MPAKNDIHLESNLIRTFLLPKKFSLEKLMPDKYSKYRNLDYNSPDKELISAYQQVKSDTHTFLDRLNFNRFTMLNPILPIKSVFLFPATVLRWFGIDLKVASSKVFSLIIYIVCYIFERYGIEILSWLSSHIIR